MSKNITYNALATNFKCAICFLKHDLISLFYFGVTCIRRLNKAGIRREAAEQSLIRSS